MGSSYQCVQVAVLNAALRKHGISDTALRQKGCESFVFSMGEFHDFSMGEFHDQGWLKSVPEGQPLFPLLCFSARFLDADTPVEELGKVYVPSEMFAYHEYAFGNVEAFHEGAPSAQVETGNFEGENPA